MAENKDSQAAFMEAVGSIKEYAKVNGNIVTREDVHSFFKDMALDDAKFQMISGYLMANGIKIQGEDSVDNEFLKLMESASDDNIDESGQHISKEEQEDKKVADDIVSHLDYEEDEKYLKIYLQDISGIQPMTDVTRSYLLMNIVEDNDKESLKLLTESYLEKIASWIEPFRGKGVLACDLVQEANLAMTAYIGQQEWLNNYEWKDKIKEALAVADLLADGHAVSDFDERLAGRADVLGHRDGDDARVQRDDGRLTRKLLIALWMDAAEKGSFQGCTTSVHEVLGSGGHKKTRRKDSVLRRPVKKSLRTFRCFQDRKINFCSMLLQFCRCGG